MAEVTVRIDDVETYHGVSKKTDKEYTKFSVKAGGKKYVTFKREIVEPAGALKNQLAVLTYSEDDYGYTLEGVSAATGATESPSRPTLDTQSHPALQSLGLAYTPPAAQEYISSRTQTTASSPNKDLSIARAVALKAAVETATGLQLAEADSDAILRIANRYVSWLLNGESNPFADLQETPNADEPVELTQGGALLAGAGL